MNRYLTNWYVATSREEASRLAGIDGTPEDKIQITEGVEPVHVTGTWILWDDNKFTTGIGADLPQGGQLTKAAESLISTVRGADWGTVQPGGLLALTKVDQVLAETELTSGAHRGIYASERIERWDIRWRDGSESPIFIHTAGYFEGYQFDVYLDLETLRQHATPAPGPEGISTFPPDDFDYDPELGFIAKDD